MKSGKIIITSLFVIVGVIVLYHAVYFEKLDARRQKELVKNFKPNELVDYFWKNKLNVLLKNALDNKIFDSLLRVNPELLVTKYGKNIGISSNYCFLVKGRTRVASVSPEEIVLESGGFVTYRIPCKFIFSNTARDAVGFFKVDDFANSIDFNAISSELNAKIVHEVINKTGSVKTGNLLDFLGAVEINKETPSRELSMIPFKIEVSK